MNIDIHFIFWVIFLPTILGIGAGILWHYHNKQNHSKPFIVKEYVATPVLIRRSAEVDTSQWKIDFLKQKAIEALCDDLSKKPELFDVIVRDSYISPAFKNIEVYMRILPSESRTTSKN